MRYSYPYYLPALLVILLIIAGCNKNDLLSSAPGEYNGSVTVKRSGHTSHSLVSSEIKAQSKSELEIRSSSPDREQFTIRIRVESKNKIWLLLPDWENTEVLLNRSANKCFESKSNPDTFSATVCFNGVDLTVAMNWGPAGDAFTLLASQASLTPYPLFESPQSYSVSELINQAISQNFDSAIQFEHVVQAKLKTQTAYLNLIPHIAFTSSLNIATLIPIGYLKAVGDLVPFLFPTRWLQAKEEHYRSEAEFDAWILAKANAANVAEGLAYGVLRDESILTLFNEFHIRIEEILVQIRELELSNRTQPGASDDIEIIINSIDQGLVVLRSALVEEKMALAQACGFFNFAAITSVKSLNRPSFVDIQPYDDITVKRMSNLAIDRSYELRQINALIKAARLEKIERYFQWLDPVSDQNARFGINLFPYIKIGASQIQELLNKRQKLELELISAVARAANTANQSLESYQLVGVGLSINNRRIERQLNSLKAGVSWSLGDLTDALKDKLKEEVELLNLQYTYYTVVANLNRFLLIGSYAYLPTNLAQPEWLILPTVQP